ncbi:MAG: hypothetical protein II161_03765 [Erysipelotrichaceae bacterium]|nr:hypothetical protein [Erysipelotrichaceae bacterium]
MSVYEVLTSGDNRIQNPHYNYYNGTLKEYIENSSIDQPEYESLFADMVAADEDVRICVGLPIDINHKTISNQIIRYRDAFKLPEGYMRIPYVIYWRKNDKEGALILSVTNYIEAKGYYFCITEASAVLAEAKNEVVATVLAPETAEEVKAAFRDLNEGKRNPGAVQRALDRKYYGTVDEMKERCIGQVQDIFEEAVDVLKTLDDDQRGDVIYTVIGRTFLAKKAMYVQYMMAKDMLETRHEGEIKKQRQFAKAYVDEIPIVSLSSLWRTERE